MLGPEFGIHRTLSQLLAHQIRIESTLRDLQCAIEVFAVGPLSELTLHEVADMVRPVLQDHKLPPPQLAAITEFVTGPVCFYDGLANANAFDWGFVSSTMQSLLRALLACVSTDRAEQFQAQPLRGTAQDHLHCHESVIYDSEIFREVLDLCCVSGLLQFRAASRYHYDICSEFFD